MGGLIMKKILASLCLIIILSAGAVESNVSANGFDKIPPVMMKSFSAPTDQINHFM